MTHQGSGNSKKANDHNVLLLIATVQKKEPHLIALNVLGPNTHLKPDKCSIDKIVGPDKLI